MKTIAVNQHGYYGRFGGAYIPEMLYPNVEELRNCYLEMMQEQQFQRDFQN
ncbi:MAG: tryptophan synthase subunit beta, partial [Bacteroidota bacterium]